VLLYGPVVYFIAWPKFVRIFRGDDPTFLRTTATSKTGIASSAQSELDEGSRSGSNLYKDQEKKELKPKASKGILGLHESLVPLSQAISSADPVELDMVNQFVVQFDKMDAILKG
jgi:hypothetical protein